MAARLAIEGLIVLGVELWRSKEKALLDSFVYGTNAYNLKEPSFVFKVPLLAVVS